MIFVAILVITESKVKDMSGAVAETEPKRIDPAIIYSDWKTFRLYETIVDGNKIIIIIANGNGVAMLNLGKVEAEAK